MGRLMIYVMQLEVVIRAVALFNDFVAFYLVGQAFCRLNRKL